MQKIKHLCNDLLHKCFFLVEVVGLEPTSYSAAKILSTYLFYLLFLKTQRG